MLKFQKPKNIGSLTRILLVLIKKKCIFHLHLRHKSEIRRNIRQSQNISQTFPKYISVIAQAYLKYITNKFQGYLRHISGIFQVISQIYLRYFQTQLWHISGNFQVNLGKISDIYQAYSVFLNKKFNTHIYIFC